MDPDGLVASSISDVFHWWQTRDSGLLKIKPRVIFSQVERAYGYGGHLTVPTPSSLIGSITTLEATLLLSLMRIVRARNIVELGTYLGYSSALFALNMPEDGVVITIDLPDHFPVHRQALGYSEARLHQCDTDNDEFLRAMQAQLGPVYIQALPDRVKNRVRILKSDSRYLTSEEPEFEGSWDAVFIDGGHDQETVQSDTRLAMDLIDGQGMIVWHDFDSRIHGEVTEVVETFAQAQRVLWMEHTLLAVAPFGRAAEMLIN